MKSISVKWIKSTSGGWNRYAIKSDAVGLIENEGLTEYNRLSPLSIFDADASYGNISLLSLYRSIFAFIRAKKQGASKRPNTLSIARFFAIVKSFLRKKYKFSLLNKNEFWSFDNLPIEKRFLSVLYYRHRKEGTLQWESKWTTWKLRNEGKVQWEIKWTILTLRNVGKVQWTSKLTNLNLRNGRYRPKGNWILIRKLRNEGILQWESNLTNPNVKKWKV